RLKETAVLGEAIRDGIALLTWEEDSFAYAESYDGTAKRYRGLRHNQRMNVAADDVGLLVKPAVARKQIDAETAPVPSPDGGAEKATKVDPVPTPNLTGP